MAAVSYDIGPRLEETLAPVDRLFVGFTPRHRGVSEAHVERLIESGGDWPPLLVQRATMRVIDGAHRLAAARALGWSKIEVVYFDGDDDAAKIEAICRNRDHGLPLTLQDRKSAARDLLGRHPDWSDGKIAEICSLSPKTVASQREQQAPTQPTSSAAACEYRLGRDARRHPVASTPVRARIAEALAKQPNASLRAIAAVAQASPETVRAVRRALQQEPAPGAAPSAPLLTDVAVLPTVERRTSSWGDDSAVVAIEGGAAFAAWFDAAHVDEMDLFNYVSAIPLSRVYEVVDEARRRAQFWKDFAEVVGHRARR